MILPRSFYFSNFVRLGLVWFPHYNMMKPQFTSNGNPVYDAHNQTGFVDLNFALKFIEHPRLADIILQQRKEVFDLMKNIEWSGSPKRYKTSLIIHAPSVTTEPHYHFPTTKNILVYGYSVPSCEEDQLLTDTTGYVEANNGTIYDFKVNKKFILNMDNVGSPHRAYSKDWKFYWATDYHDEYLTYVPREARGDFAKLSDDAFQSIIQ